MAGSTLPLSAFIAQELGWGSALGWSRPANRPGDGAMAGFLRVPLFMERFLIFAHALAVDLFLFHFTLLPLRILFSAAMLLLSLLKICFRAITPRGLWSAAMTTSGGDEGKQRESSPPPSSSIFRLTRAGLYDVLKGLIILTATTVLGSIQVSRVYHWIRGEAALKLYVIFGILEIGDKLCSSVGTDVMDALYRLLRDDRDLETVGKWLHGEATGDDDGDGNGDTGKGLESIGIVRLLRSLFTTSKASDWKPLLGPVRLAWQVFLAVLYTTFHSCVIFVQIVCLNVALNSRNNSLLTLLISNNFVELKGSVFKKFEPANLFQIACADAVERFQLSLFLSLIILQEGASSSLISSALFIWGAEMVVDSVKHSFVCKFNRLHADLYSTFTAILAHDYVSVRGRIKTSLDPTHACVRRLGLSPIPLCCVLLRITLTNVHPSWFPRAVTSATGFFALFAMIICLALAKLALSMVLLAYSSRVINDQRGRLVAAAERAQVTAGGAAPNAAAGPSGNTDAATTKGAGKSGLGAQASHHHHHNHGHGHGRDHNNEGGGGGGDGDGASGQSVNSDLIKQSARGHQHRQHHHHNHNHNHSGEAAEPRVEDEEEEEEEHEDHSSNENGLLHPSMTSAMLMTTMERKPGGGRGDSSHHHLSPASGGTASLLPSPAAAATAADFRPDFAQRYLAPSTSSGSRGMGMPGLVTRRGLHKNPSSSSSSYYGSSSSTSLGSSLSFSSAVAAAAAGGRGAAATPGDSSQPFPRGVGGDGEEDFEEEEDEEEEEDIDEASATAPATPSAGPITTNSTNNKGGPPMPSFSSQLHLPNRPFIVTTATTARPSQSSSAAEEEESSGTPLAMSFGQAGGTIGGGVGTMKGHDGTSNSGGLVISPGGICATPLLRAEHARLSEHDNRQRMLMMTVLPPPSGGRRRMTRDSIKEEEEEQGQGQGQEEDGHGNNSNPSASSNGAAGGAGGGGRGKHGQGQEGDFQIRGPRAGHNDDDNKDDEAEETGSHHSSAADASFEATSSAASLFVEEVFLRSISSSSTSTAGGGAGAGAMQGRPPVGSTSSSSSSSLFVMPRRGFFPPPAAAIPIAAANTTASEEETTLHSGAVGGGGINSNVTGSAFAIMPQQPQAAKQSFLKLASPPGNSNSNSNSGGTGQRLVARVRLSSSSISSASSMAAPAPLVAVAAAVGGGGGGGGGSVAAPATPTSGHQAATAARSSSIALPREAATTTTAAVTTPSLATLKKRHAMEDEATLLANMLGVERYSSHQGKAIPL